MVAARVECFDRGLVDLALSDDLSSRVAAICFFYSVYGEKTKGVLAQAIEFRSLNNPSHVTSASAGSPSTTL